MANGSESNGRGRRRWERWIIASLLVLLLVYAASPYVSFWRFTEAVKSGDRQRLESHVDFRSVRQSLKVQLRAKLPKPAPPAPGTQQDAFAGLVERLGPGLIDQLVDSFVTPEGLAALITNPELARNPTDTRAPGQAEQNGERELDWSQVKYAFFTGPRDFLIDLEGMKLRFRFSQRRWTLKTVELP